MPKSILSAAAIGCLEKAASPSRRSRLAFGAALGGAALPSNAPAALAASDKDAAILAHMRDAADIDDRAGDLAAAIDRRDMEGLQASLSDDAALHDLDDAYRSASEAILDARPRSIAGVRAILARRGAVFEPDDTIIMIDALLASPALALALKEAANV